MNRCIRAVTCASAATLLAAAGQAHAVWGTPFDIYQAGLTDADHTSSIDGSQVSSIYGLADADVLFGHSNRYAADGSSAGVSAWAWHYTGVATNSRLGFFDTDHTQANNYQLTQINGFNNAGQAYGTSTRTDNGASAWTWSTSLGNVRLGFTDTAHTRDDGFQSSGANAINASGQVIGSSSRYDAPGVAGSSAWSWTSTGGTMSIGLSGVGYTRGDGLRSSFASGLNDAGQVTGTSVMYNGSAYAGIAAWTWTQGNGNTRLGLTDAEHTSALNIQSSTPFAPNDNGQVIGFSERYVGDHFAGGQSAWSWTAAGGTVRLGFTDAEHTYTNAADGSNTQSSAPAGFNNAGRVIGTSNRYTIDNTAGNSAWVWDASSGITRIGLFTGAEFTQDVFDTQLSSPEAINQAGRVMGTSSRFSGTDQTGQAAWTWNADTGTTRIGLTTAPYISSLSNQFSDPVQMNEDGRIVGISERYQGGLGQSVWTWTPSGGTLMIGLTDTPTAGAAGHQTSGRPQVSGRHHNEFVAMNEAGQITGTAQRYSTSTLNLGTSGWFFDPASNTTVAIDAFVFDPNASSDGTAAGEARTTPALLTASGIVLGSYDLYTDGTPTSHAFIWSTDNSFADLGALVDGGISAQGWDLLANVIAADELELIAGYDNLFDLFGGSQGVYVLTTIPAPATTTLLALAGLAASRRRR